MPVRCMSIVNPPEGRVAVVRRRDALDAVRYSRLIENTRADTLVVRRQGETTPLLQVGGDLQRVGIGANPASNAMLTVSPVGLPSYLVHASYNATGDLGPFPNLTAMRFAAAINSAPASAATGYGVSGQVTAGGGDGGNAITLYGVNASAYLINMMKTWTAGKTHNLYGGYFTAGATNYAGSIPSDVNAYSGYFADPAVSASGTVVKRAAYFAGDIELANGKNLHVATSTGTKLGTAAGQQLGFWGVTPVTQRAANADTSGVSLGDLETEVNEIKQALRDVGIIAT